jgi:uncharacterized membrane-anchored protein YhcB (DUF1043 family)
MMHYIIVILIIAVIVTLQFNSFFSNLKKMHNFKNVFPNNKRLKKEIQEVEREYEQIVENIENSNEFRLKSLLRDSDCDISNFYEEPYDEYGRLKGQEILDKKKARKSLKEIAKKAKSDKISELRSAYKTSQNQIFTTIENSIKDYVEANKGGVSDFHLMKDIVDRNCDAKEEEIQTQIPVPLYLGLVGTMAGILVGILYLWLSGGLSDLLNSGSGNNGADGVEALLGGVALAMISSICGIVLTTIGSSIFKIAKNQLERDKHAYLSKIQTELLPTLSTDVSSSLVKMSQNLQHFNSTFSQNTDNLGEVLQSVNQATDNIARTLEAINNMKMKQIASANIEVYEKLKNCTDEIGKLGEYLRDINQYQTNTTDAIEKMQGFFSKGIEQIDSINLGVKNALERFAENSKSYFGSLQENLDTQILDINSTAKKQQVALQKHFDDLFEVIQNALALQQQELKNHFAIVSEQMKTAATEQQKIFAEKLTNLNKLADELQNLSAVKNSLVELTRQSTIQSQQMAQLTRAIHELAEMKASGGAPRLKIPLTTQIAVIAGGGVATVAGLTYIVLQILKFL